MLSLFTVLKIQLGNASSLAMSWKTHFCAGKPVHGATCSTLSLGTAGLMSGSHFPVMIHTSLAKEVTSLWKTLQQCFSWEETDGETAACAPSHSQS